MRLEIGSRHYDLRITGGDLKVRGRRKAAVCDHRRRRILISSMVPAAIRPELAALTVSEAWKRELIQRPPVDFVGDVS